MRQPIRRRILAIGGITCLTFATVAVTPLAAAAAPTDNEKTPSAHSFARDTMGSTIRANDPHYSRTSEPKSMAPRARTLATPSGTRGIDVSHWQGNINWSAVSSNVKFAYIKATESTTYTDPQFNDNYLGSYNEGIIRGAYHFALPDKSSGAKQANFFVNHGGGWSGDGKTLPPLLDIEYNPYGSTCYGLTDSQMVSWIKSFVNRMKKLTGRPPAIYTTTDWWKTCTGNSSKFSDSPLFIARYNSTVGTLPNGWPFHTFWQYSDADNPPSYPGDQDVFNGSVKQLKTLAKGKSDPPHISNGHKKRVRLGASGWDQYSHLVTPGDFNGDKKADLIAMKPSGSLWFYAGTGKVTYTRHGTAPKHGFKKRVRLGASGWDQYSYLIGPGDFNGDKKADLIAMKPNGSLWFYAGTGKVTYTRHGTAPKHGFKKRVQIGSSGWNQYSTIVGVGDFNGDKKPDLVARKKNGSLWFVAGTGNASKKHRGFRKRVRLGASGWNQYSSIVGVGDFNGDKKPDLVARKKNGSLWFYAGTGKVSRTYHGTAPKHGFKKRVRIGRSGWDQYSFLVGPGDFNGDKKADLIAMRPIGSLWFYAGTGDAGKS